jgi:hypothetical protein
MINIREIFDSFEAAEKFRDEMYRAYHPLGYGTHIRIELQHDINGARRWVAWGSRAESCD